MHKINQLTAQIPVRAYDLPADEVYGRIRAALEKDGQPIGLNDLLIAAQTIADDLILVSDNVREFSRIDGLKLENWLR
jgi:tRNA(fMet)-specific endonuclease VapC